MQLLLLILVVVILQYNMSNLLTANIFTTKRSIGNSRHRVDAY